MTATQAQIAFAAEFVLFLAALAGVSVLVLRSALLAEGRLARWAMAAGFLAVGAAAFVHGSLVEPDGGSPAVVVLRLVGLGLLGGATIGRGRGSLPVTALRLAVLVLAAAEMLSVLADQPGTAVDVVRVVGAVVLASVLFIVSRRSIPARVAAGAAGTVLLVVLAVSVTLSTVVVDNVRKEVLRRTSIRAASEAGAARRAPDAARMRAASVAQLFVARTLDLADAQAAKAQQYLLALAADPSSPTGVDAADLLSVTLQQLSADSGTGLVTAEGLLAFVTPSGVVVPGPGLPDSGSVRAQLGFLDVVQDALTNRRQPESAPEILNERLLAVGVAPVVLQTRDGPQFVGAVVAADALTDTTLTASIRDDPDLSLAIVGEDGVLAHAGQQPTSADLRAVAIEALRSGSASGATTAGRFLAASPVLSGARPIAAIVASAPSRLADVTRQRLFRTLFIVALLATLAAIVLAALIGNRIGRGLQRLTSTAEEIQAGNLDVKVGLSQADELGVLGTAFDRMAGSLRTMTDELREAAIDEARLRGRLEAVIGGMGEALVAVDVAGNVGEFNTAAEELFGVPASEVRGRPVLGLSLRGPNGEDLGMRLSQPGSPWASEATVTQPDGVVVPVAVSGAALRGAAGELAGSVAVVRDMRREREVERMKTEFLSNISHEMKTPLTPIKGYAQMLSTRDLAPERAREFAAEIMSGARQMERVINQLVNFATMAAGRLEPHPETLRARAVLDGLLDRWADRMGEDHEVERRVSRGTPDLLVDRRLLDLSLDELLDNAVKYSPDGGRITITAESDGNGSVLVSVTDRGVGVPEDRRETIFGEFAQGDGSSTREFGGLGLGLPMVRHVAQVHGGELTCESTVGKGSTFTLRLPAAVS
ncbi:MAG: hypothetical protein JWN29_2215 [Acidimicrobiales bacterium]|nr:hypothetical protein [Acidimicrobiales bacterium]